MNSLELEFLFSINFALQVPTEVYEKYNVELVNHVNRPAVPCECRAWCQWFPTTFLFPSYPHFMSQMWEMKFSCGLHYAVVRLCGG